MKKALLLIFLIVSTPSNILAGETKHSDAPPEIPDIKLGSDQAKITLIEYSSLNCASCASFHKKGFERLKIDLINTGRLHYIFRHFPIDMFAVHAMTIIAGQPKEQWFELTKRAYSTQGNWVRGDLKDFAKCLNLPPRVVETALNNNHLVEKVMAKRFNAEKKINIEGTPLFILLVKKPGQEIYQEIINGSISSQELKERILKHV